MLVTEREQLTKEVRDLADQLGRDRTSLVPILQRVKATYSQIDPYALLVIADELDIHRRGLQRGLVLCVPRRRPPGQFVLRLCRTISCDLQGGPHRPPARNDLGVVFGETTADGKFTLEWANCMGMCDQGPRYSSADASTRRSRPQGIRSRRVPARLRVFAPEHRVRGMAAATTGPLTYSTIEPEMASGRPWQTVPTSSRWLGPQGRGAASPPISSSTSPPRARRKKYVIWR
jgi:[NiFe] hydrogenase diaphorase moiety large subunit